MVYVESDADNNVTDARSLGIHLRQNTAEFAAAEQNVIGPAQIRMQAGNLFDRFRYRNAGNQRDWQRFSRGTGGTQHDRAIDTDRLS